MEKRKLARKIWEDCFRDSIEETNFYFENIFQEENWKYYEEENQVLASLHENFCSILLQGNRYSYPYFVGVATQAEHRGKSYMTKLLFQEFKNLKAKGVDFCFLTPINSSLYRSFGFEYFSALEEYSFSMDCLKNFSREKGLEIVELTKENIEQYTDSLSKIYSICMLPYFSSFERKKEDFRRILEEVKLSEGKGYLFFQNQRAAAYVFFYPEKNSFVLRECLSTNPKSYESIFFFFKGFRDYYDRILMQSPENLHLEFFLPNQTEVEKKFLPFMMGRILSPKLFLQKCKFQAPQIRIFIEDPVLVENTGFYTLNEEVSFSQLPQEEYDFSIGIRELVPLCFGFFSFQDLLYLGKIKLHSVEQLEFLKNLFPKKFNFFHEYW